MKCPHCNGEHPDNFKFCPETGEEIVPQFKACTNRECPDYGKYILPLEAKFCPRCGRALDVQNEQKRENVADKDGNSITRYNIVLGETTVAMLQDEYDLSMDVIDENEEDDLQCYKLSDSIFCVAKTDVAPIVFVGIKEIENNPDMLSEILHIHKVLTPSELKSVCRKKNWQSKYNDEDEVMVILQTANRRLVCCFFEDNLLTRMVVTHVPKCPHCSEGHQFQIEDVDDAYYGNVILRCRNCRKEIDLSETIISLMFCPECGSVDFEDNGSGHMQYTCNNCGHIWGDSENDDEE